MLSVAFVKSCDDSLVDGCKSRSYHGRIRQPLVRNEWRSEFRYNIKLFYWPYLVSSRSKSIRLLKALRSFGLSFARNVFEYSPRKVAASSFQYRYRTSRCSRYFVASSYLRLSSLK